MNGAAFQFDPLTPHGYDVVSIDFPWDFKTYSKVGNTKGAAAHYGLLSLDAIKTFRINDLAKPDCLLLMWACEWMRPSDREAVMTGSGFTYRSTIMWRKVTARGKPRMGTGYRARTMHEPVHIGTIGRPKHRAFPSVFDGVARGHSRKPEEFFALVERHTPGATRADVFARQLRPGWDGFGDEIDKFAALEGAK